MHKRRGRFDRAGWGIWMKTRLASRGAIAWGWIAALMMLAAPAHAEKRVALVIGNNDYKNVPKLQKAVNDARTMGDTLKQLGFSVMVAENQTRQQFSQTPLDRLSSDDASPNSVFTRTFAKELLQPAENLVEVAQHTRRLVSEMAETIGHKQIPAYSDQMVDNVFLNGAAKETTKETTKE